MFGWFSKMDLTSFGVKATLRSQTDLFSRRIAKIYLD